jgi:plastocyanin
MRFDVTKLPLGEALIGFVLAAVALTFVLAFAFPTESGLRDETVVGSPTPEVTPTPAGSPGAGIAVSMKDNLFEPAELTVKAGEAVTINLTNDGVAIHNMRIAGADGKYNTDDDGISDPDIVQSGGTAKLDWTAPAQPGQVKFQCDFHVTVGMVGTITVQ